MFNHHRDGMTRQGKAVPGGVHERRASGERLPMAIAWNGSQSNYHQSINKLHIWALRSYILPWKTLKTTFRDTTVVLYFNCKKRKIQLINDALVARASDDTLSTNQNINLFSNTKRAKFTESTSWSTSITLAGYLTSMEAYV